MEEVVGRGTYQTGAYAGDSGIVHRRIDRPSAHTGARFMSYVDRGAVCYSNRAKTEMLGVQVIDCPREQ